MGFAEQNSDEVEKNNDCIRNLHLTTACGRASPQGEAFGKLHLNRMCRNCIAKQCIDINLLRDFRYVLLELDMPCGLICCLTATRFIS